MVLPLVASPPHPRPSPPREGVALSGVRSAMSLRRQVDNRGANPCNDPGRPTTCVAAGVHPVSMVAITLPLVSPGRPGPAGHRAPPPGAGAAVPGGPPAVAGDQRDD